MQCFNMLVHQLCCYVFNAIYILLSGHFLSAEKFRIDRPL